MRTKFLKSQLQLWLAAIFFAVFMLCFLPENIQNETYIFSSCCLVLAVVIFEVKKRLPDLPLFFFNITYFLFVLSGGLVTILSGKSIQGYVGASEDATLTATRIAWLGLFLIDSVYYIFFYSPESYKKRVINDGKVRVKPTEPCALQKYFVCILLMITSLCKIFMVVENYAYSSAYGYVSLYVRESSNLPGPIRYIGAWFYFSLMLFLACNFKKWCTYLVFFIVGVLELMILFTGDRAEAVCGLLILLVYTIVRCKYEPNFVVAKKLAIFILLLMLPVGLYILQVIKYTRVGNENNMGFWQGVIEFFESQGLSLGIIGYSKEMRQEIGDIAGNHFIIGQLIGYLQQNVFSRVLFGLKAIAGNTVEMARSGFSYGSSMAYLRFPTSYLSGIGCGTCFLTELYHDMSYFGIFIGCVGISFVLKKINELTNVNWIIYAMELNCMRSIFMLPRGAYFKWLTETLSIPNLMVIAMVVLCGAVSQTKRRKAK